MQDYNYSYKSRHPNSSNNYWYEGANWKHKSRWKKNRPQCGAKCRNGQPCKAKAVINAKTDKPLNGRCRMHGGLSCGPKTVEGKRRSAKAARERMLRYWSNRMLGTTSPPPIPSVKKEAK
jgi:hypothetical protein